MTTFNFRNVIVKPTRLNNLLDPIIISDINMTPLYSDIFRMPSEISDHDAAVALFILLLKSSKSIFSYCQISLVNEHEVDFGHLRKATAAS
jgi:hypothetical protein